MGNKNGLKASQNCPTSPTIPEEDDILDIDSHLLREHELSGHSSCGFSSNSDSDSSCSSSTDHEWDDTKNKNKNKDQQKIPNPPKMQHHAVSCPKFKIVQSVQNLVESEYESEDEDNHEESMERLLCDTLDGVEGDTMDSPQSVDTVASGNHLRPSMFTNVQETNNTLDIISEKKMRARSDSNTSNVSSSSSCSSSSSSSSSSGSSDWDEEVREEEEFEAMKLQKLQTNHIEQESKNNINDINVK